MISIIMSQRWRRRAGRALGFVVVAVATVAAVTILLMPQDSSDSTLVPTLAASGIALVGGLTGGIMVAMPDSASVQLASNGRALVPEPKAQLKLPGLAWRTTF